MTVVSLSEKQRLLRDQLLRRGGLAAPVQRRIPRRAEAGPAPLSFGQSRLWFLQHLHLDSTTYNISETLGLEGALDPGALVGALAEVTRRHEVLRTVFFQGKGEEPVQIVAPAARPAFSLADLTGLPEELRTAAASRAAEQLAATPFDLERGPVLRAALLRLGPEDCQEHILALTLHHIATDGWSMGLLLRELVTLYEAFAAGRPSPLPELSLQYADFAAWQREHLSGAAQERHLAYWKERLAGASALLELPTDRPRPAVHSSRGGQAAIGVDAVVAAALRHFAHREGSTPFMAVLAVLGALLHRYSQQPEVMIGSPSANRGRPELEGLIGFFVNTLALRVDLQGDPSFATLVGRVRETVLGAEAHQDLPFEQIVDALDLPRDLSRTPLFQVLLAYQNLPPVTERPGRLLLRRIASEVSTARFELSLALSDTEQGLGGSLTYPVDLFDPPTARRLASHFETLLKGAVHRPEIPLSELPLLSEAELHQLVQESGSAGTWPDPQGSCIHELFGEQVARTPEALAVVDEEGAWTYEALGRRVRHLALRLRAAGAGPDQPVLLCAERGAGLVAGLLGILEAGGAYLAVEPDLPRLRQELLAADAGVTVAVTERRLTDVLPTGLRRIFLDPETPEDLAAPAGERPRPPVLPDNLAYVLYTSGSTGRPKGVMVEHRQLAAYVRGIQERLAPPPGASFATVSSFAADLGHTSIFAALLGGGCLHVVSRERLADATALAERMERQPVDALKIVPSHLAALLTAERPERSLPRRFLVLGGEPLPWSLVERVRALAPDCRLFNHYGPTETTVGVLSGPIDEMGGFTGSASAPLGRPVGRTRVWVVDRHRQLVPPGVPGELCVGGPQVTRGYLGRPDLTAERFIPDPFSGGAGERLYRTGDLVRRRTGAPVEILGRIDDQVKVRGFRIELGEIEAALASLPGVREAVVLAREDRSAGGPGDRRLVAYVVSDAAADGLRHSLRERLPDYMLPAAFVTLPALPLTSNGKVDRKALPAPEWQRTEKSHLAPRTPVEEVLAGIWSELLGLEQVGANDHFFDLGGHSLLATRVMSRLPGALGVEMPLRDLFEAPVLADLAVRVEAARRAGAGQVVPPLVPVPRDGALPLSFAQQRLWFIDQLQPGTPLYNIPVALRVEGPLDAGVLALSLREVVRRHESLRTVFVESDGSPEQVIRPATIFDLKVVDLSTLPEGRREPLAHTLAAEEAGRPFDLTSGLPLRAALLRLAEEDHIALLTMHHIASDGWSRSILVREVTALYTAFAEGRPSPLPELPVQYADFAAWQRSWLHGETLENEISFWRRQLADLPPRLELPTDRPRPAMQSFRGARQPVRLPAALTRQVQALSRREGATLFMVLLAGFQALLARYSGQDDLAVGTPVAGRNRVAIEDLIGFFVNTLVLRGDLGGDPSFRELLGRVRQTALAAHTHQDVPFEKLVQELTPERSLAQTPLFQVMLILQNAPVENLAIQNLRLRPVGGTEALAKFDLTLSLEERNGALDGVVEHASDLFDAATIDRLMIHYERLLAGSLDVPERRLSEISLLTPSEHSQLTVEWNDTGAAYPQEACLHELFEEQAARTPDVTAVTFEDARLSYGELDRRADRLARHLRRLGVGPEVRVGICVERSLEMVVGLLGILKAGGAYVPVDPEYPSGRVTYMLEDAGVRVVLTQQRLAEALSGADGRVLLYLDGAWDPGEAAAVRASGADPDNLAYVIYTSGSTGRPKGVQIRHRSLVSFVLDMGRRLEIGPEDRLLSITSLSFDIFGLELFVPLAHGAQVRVASREATLDGALLARILEEREATVLQSTPATWRMLLETGWTGRKGLQLLCGGEELPGELAARLLGLPEGGRGLYNLFGPTETTIWSTVHRVESVRRPMPIGRPIGNTELFVLDRWQLPVPMGAAGELYIGGDGLARGYLHRGDLTAERFVPNPFAGTGARLYRTGDLARYLPDGNVEFLGRIDHQVKVRGFRIELGEIESLLTRLEGVRAAVVVARQDKPGDLRLVAYVVGDAAADALRQSLRERLPDYMVPAAFVSLAALPLTPNGKVDRKALPAPAWKSGEEGSPAPLTPVEEILGGLWTELLGVERVGADSHFFELGGHSLLATQVMSRLRKTFDIEMPLRDFFEAPTLAGLASRVEAALRTGAGRLAPPLVPVPREEPLPLSFAQQRLWFIDQLEPGTPLYNIPMVLRVEGPLDSAVLARSLSEIVRRHEALRTVFAPQDGSPVQVIRPAASFPLSMVDLTGLPEGGREALALTLTGEEARRPFDLARGPLLRGLLLRLAGDDHVVALTLHHIVSDGWSTGILLREVTALYAAFADGRPSPLPELPVQYADFAAWQRSWLHGEILDSEISFWRRQLTGLPPLLALPTDRPRPAVQSFRGAVRPVRLPAGLTRQAQALGRREGATLFMVLLAAFQALLARWSGQDDLAVGTPVAGRNRVEIEGLIGFFVNTLVLRGDLTAEPSFRDLLGRVRETALAAHTHQDVPFEKLVQELAPERSLTRTPLFQVMFALQNAPAESLEIRDLRLRPLGSAATTAKFDLLLSLVERNGELGGAVEHATSLFDTATIDHLLGHFERLLATAVASPERPFAEIPLLSDGERRQILEEWSGGPAPAPDGAVIHELFAAAAARAPHSVALVCGGDQMTYAELDARADRLAGVLRGLGVGPEALVGLCAERSIGLIVGLLAILKAGGAYLPLDPESPEERLRLLLDDAGVTVLLAGPGMAGRLPRSPAQVVDLDGELPPVPSGLPASRVDADHLAYVMYTSGSTGHPKGVSVRHRSVVRLCRDGVFARFGAREVFLQAAPVSFDASTLEIWACLLNGGRLVLPPPGALRLEQIGQAVREQGVTTLWLTAGLFHLMVDERLQDLAGVRQLLAGGDALSVPHVERVLAELPECRLINGYGPTENTTFTCCHTIEPGTLGAAGSVPIGRPIHATRVYLVDRHLAPVPAGVAGELLTGGAGLARGYLGRPDLTAERFIPDPHGGAPGERLYRTGDLCRFLDGGTVEFLGRIDQQVKIRGFRVEPGEVEAALRQHPDVREAAVVAVPDGLGQKRLVAYVVAAEGAAPESAELRRFLSGKLSDSMVPSACVLLEHLPVTPNGKVDRRALEQRDAATVSTAAYREPRAPVERELARIWEELLGVGRVSLDDDFFHLGGHSLLAVGLISRIERQLGRKLPLAALFQAPTLEQLAQVLDETPQATLELSPLVPLQPEGDAPPWFFLHPVDGQVHAYVDLARSLGEGGIPVFALQAPGLKDLRLVLDDVPAIAASYISVLREVQPQGPYFLAGWSGGGTLAFEMARVLRAQGQPVGALVLIDTLQYADPTLAGDDLALWVYLVEMLGEMSGNQIDRGAWREVLQPLDHDARLAHVAADLTRRGLLPAGLGTDSFERMLGVYFAINKALRSYEPEPYPGPGVLVRATDTVAVSHFTSSRDASYGWAPLFKEHLAVHDVPGDHNSILSKEKVDAVASIFARLRSGKAFSGEGATLSSSLTSASRMGGETHLQNA